MSRELRAQSTSNPSSETTAPPDSTSASPTTRPRHQHRRNGFQHRPPSFHHHRPPPGDRRGGPQGRVQEEPRDSGASNSPRPKHHHRRSILGIATAHASTNSRTLQRPDERSACTLVTTVCLRDGSGLTGHLGGCRVDSGWRDGRGPRRRRLLLWSVVLTDLSLLSFPDEQAADHADTPSLPPAGRNPTTSTSESNVRLGKDAMPWETGSAQGKYQYHPRGDTSAPVKDAPSAVNVVVVPDVELPKVRRLPVVCHLCWRMSPLWLESGLTDPLLCRDSMTSTTSGARKATR